MKLRNKKTGDIEHLLFNSYPVSGDIVLEFMDESAESGYSEYRRYTTLAKLNEEWEDVEDINVTNIPLIKDEKIRKAVKAWADGNNIESVHYDAFWRGFRRANSSITVWEELPLEDNEVYTIAELCGEEEE